MATRGAPHTRRPFSHIPSPQRKRNQASRDSAHCWRTPPRKADTTLPNGTGAAEMSTSDTKKGPRVTPPIRNRMIPRFHERPDRAADFFVSDVDTTRPPPRSRITHRASHPDRGPEQEARG
ncbi:hypothetical protein AoKodu_07370 [Actinomyces oris K20]|nr:hypothetical protein AoKodu_07370 [Actinomyces oris K20]